MYELDEPKYFYLLALIPVLAAVFVLNLWWQRKKQREFGTPQLLGHLAPERSGAKPVLKLVLILLAIAGITMGLVNPQAGTAMETVKREGIDIVFAIDVSKSMLAEDVAPSRLDRAKQIVSQIISDLGNDRIGIIGYAANAYPVLPITTDYGAAKMYLQNMNTNMVSSQGTALGDAIALASRYYDDPQTSKLLILVTDGEDHGGGSEEAAREARKKGIKIITVGVGTEKGGPIPLKKNGVNQGFKRDNNGEVVITKLYPRELKTIAEATKGGYVYGGSIREVSEYIKNAMGNIEKKEFDSKQVATYESQFQWFLGAALALLLLDIFVLEKKTAWIERLNLFNEKGS